jgi:hypothetical protein
LRGFASEPAPTQPLDIEKKHRRHTGSDGAADVAFIGIANV